MESSGGGVAALALDCEDMFKEITKKLYGEEAVVNVAGVSGVEFPAAERELEEELRPEEHITAWGLAALMQNGFPPPGILQANFQPRLEPGAEDRWSAAEEPLAWAHSRVASYNPSQKLFKCCECECVGFLARLAEHWLGTHAAARAFACPLSGCGFASGWARGVRSHLARDHHSDPHAADQLLRDNPALADLTRYLQRLKNKVEQSRLERRNEESNVNETSEGASGAAAGGGGGGAEGGKRYVCNACPYATDRRDLFTRHENIHRDEKPFHCYLCQKQFNRADHVKKHFLRMHRDQPYDLNRIRRALPKQPPPPAPAAPPPAPPSQHQPAQHQAAPAHQQSSQPPPQQQQQQQHYYSKPAAQPSPTSLPTHPTIEYRIQQTVKLERTPLMKTEPIHKSVATSVPPAPAAALPAGGGGGSGGGAAARRKGERRYSCCYCAWSGVDNWCLKRHLNTHLKPFACALCEYKAARAERLATHVHKVHNKKACAKCPFLCDDSAQLAMHLRETHHIESRNLKVPTSVPRSGAFTGAQPAEVEPGVGGGGGGGGAAGGGDAGGAGGPRRREQRAAGAARLFGYLEASDGSGDEYEGGSLGAEYSAGGGGAGPGGGAGGAAAAGAGAGAGGAGYARDKENAAPLHHALHHEHCMRY